MVEPHSNDVQNTTAEEQDISELFGSTPLPIGKLRRVSHDTRIRLKRMGITRCDQLLGATRTQDHRAKLAEAAGVPEDVLFQIVCRADLSRVNGVGAVFGDMLELLDIFRVEQIASVEAETLHQRLVDLNAAERLARRAPTLEEVEDWVNQARALVVIVEAGDH